MSRATKLQEKPSKCGARCLPSGKPAQGQSLGAQGVSQGVQQSTGGEKIHSATWEQSWIKLRWVRIGTEMTV